MARIPLVDIPNAPQSGGAPISNAVLSNPDFPGDRVGDSAISQIRQGYQSNMVDMRAETAMGNAMQSFGADLTQTGNNLMDATGVYVGTVRKEAELQFLQNMQGLQDEIEMKAAGTTPDLYPVVVADTYKDKERMFAGISPMGRRFVEPLAARAEAKDMAKWGLKTYLSTLEQQEGQALFSMNRFMQKNQFDDAATINESLFATRKISPAQYASNKQTIETQRDHQGLMQFINANPTEAMNKFTSAFAAGQQVEGFENISSEMLPKYAKIAEAVGAYQTTEKLNTVVSLIDSAMIADPKALSANPVFQTLDTEKQQLLARRLVNNKRGTPEGDLALTEAINRIDQFPRSSNLAKEFEDFHLFMAANVPDPHYETVSAKFQAKWGELLENGGILKPNSKLEQYVANAIETRAKGGIWGEYPASNNEGTPEYTQQMLNIQQRSMDLMEEFRGKGFRTREEADQWIDERLLTTTAKSSAGKTGVGFFQRFFTGDPTEQPRTPKDRRNGATPSPAPTPSKTPSPTGSEVSMFDPDIADLTGGAYTFKVTEKTRDALPASTPSARQVSLDFNDAASPTAKGVEIVIPNDATEQERAIAKAYVDRTTEWFRSKGIDVPNRGVRTAKENGRGTPGRFHTEPFFVGHADALAAVQSDPDGYAQILASTLGRIEGVTFIAPHKSNDPGAGRGNITERDFAQQVIIPALKKLAT
jgi:hypothetical protein